MQLIYISGPMSGLPDYNRGAFRAIARDIANAEIGMCPVHTAWMEDGAGYDTYMDVALHLLMKCDAILFLDGWEKSAGALAEKELAKRFGLTHYYERPFRAQMLGVPLPYIR